MWCTWFIQVSQVEFKWRNFYVAISTWQISSETESLKGYSFTKNNWCDIRLCWQSGIRDCNWSMEKRYSPKKRCHFQSKRHVINKLRVAQHQSHHTKHRTQWSRGNWTNSSQTQEPKWVGKTRSLDSPTFSLKSSYSRWDQTYFLCTIA